MLSAKSLLIVLSLSASTAAFAHARFKVSTTTDVSPTPPRNDSTGLKTGPCGDVARTATPKVYKPGQEIDVKWEETINHPGYFIIKFSKANDIGFDDYVLVPKFVDSQNDPIANSKYHQFTTKVKLPNITCDTCTLQLIQHMDDAPERPYYSCSDIKLVGDGTTPAPTTPTTTPAPAPAPTATPAPTAKKPDKPVGVKVEK